MKPLINDLIMALNSLGVAFCDYTGSMLIQSCVLIVLLFFVDFLIRKRIRATLRYWIWILVFVKLILPPSLSLPTGLGYWRGEILSSAPPALEEILTNAPHEFVEPSPLISGTPILFEIPQNQLPKITAEVTSPATPVVSSLNTLTWQAGLFVLWFVGVLIFSALLIQRMRYVERLIAESEPADNRFAKMLNYCCEQIGLRHPIELHLSNNVSSPAVCGFFKPVILMPTALIEKLSPDKLRAVLIHELCHIKRGDLWINAAQTILQIIYFYNPLVWVVNVMVRRIREKAVDEMVLVTLDTGIRDYSNTLIDIAETAFFKSNLSLRLIGVVESKKALEGRIKHMLNRPSPKSKKLGILGLTTVLIFGAVLLPMARAQKQSTSDISSVLDSDKDGLENEFEAELGTNPKSPDTDGDGLSDYDEYCKYRTDPTKKDSDGDGKPDGDWQERREYVYSIRAICEIRPPSNMEIINDLYQDARPAEKKATHDDAKVVEVLLFPFSTVHVYAQPFPKENLDKELKEYIKPTTSMNFSPEMKEKIGNIVRGAETDVEAIEKMLQWMNNETSLEREMPHWEYLYVIDGDIVWHQSLGSSERDKKFLETNFLGDSMFKNRVHGTCSSIAILRGSMFRAAGLPTRLIQTLPLMTRYSEDSQPLADQLRMRAMAKGYDWGPGNGGANHTYNEVFLNNRWVRVDNSIGTGPFVGDKLFVKAWSAPSWNNLKEEWNDKRCFRALHVSDAYPKYESELGKADIVIENKDLTVKKQPDGRFRAHLSIHNLGNTATPQFKVIFYAGDPDKKGRKVYPGHHNAGPIMPGSTWNEGTLPFDLNEDDTEIFVIVDPDNITDESDETNNKASAVVPGREPKESIEAETLSKQDVQKEKVTTKSSGIDIKPTQFDIRLDKNRRTFDLAVLITNQSSLVLPRFKLRFYRGDPGNNLDEAGNVQEGWHRAGPIEPGKSWGERTRSFHLPDGQYEFNVHLDFDNTISEIDENNNRAELKVTIENGRIADKSVTCPSSPEDLKSDVQDKGKVVSAGSKIPLEMAGTWLFDNPHGDEEQMSIFPDGRVVVLYSNGHKDQTNIVDGYIELAEYKNARCRMAVREDGTLVQYFGQTESSVKQWRRISSEPHTNLLGALSDSWRFKGKYLVKLSDDVTVELVGVCDWPKEGKRCWQPDGSQLPMEIYAVNGNQSPGAGLYGFMFKVAGPDYLKFSCNIFGAGSTEGSCKVMDAFGRQFKDLTASISDMEKGRLSTTIRVGVAAGPWETIANHDGRRMTIARQGDVLWSQAFQTSTGTYIVASREWRKDQTDRVIAIDKEGKLHTAGSGSVASGNIDQLTASFRNLKLEQIEEFRYEVRPYQWVEFKNVSLLPGHKTDVEF